MSAIAVEVDFDDEVILRYASRGSPLLFGIRVVSRGASYPDANWLDFGAIVLTATQRLIAGHTEESLRFMDGPFALRAHRGGDNLELRATNGGAFSAKTTVDEWSSSLVVASTFVLAHARSIGVWGKDCDALLICRDELHEVLKHLTSTAR